jgi:type IV pilus assembly protein PilY1
MVLFGTGSYFRNSDLGATPTQWLMGLQDRPDDASPISFNHLLEQDIVAAEGVLSEFSGLHLRSSTNKYLGNDQRGWYMALKSGERVVSSPVAALGGGSRVRFSTLIPDESDPCGGGREGFVMNLVANTGGSGGVTSFDLDRDGDVDSEVQLSGAAVTGVKMAEGESIVTVEDAGSNSEQSFDGKGQGGPGLEKEGREGRISWRQM